MSSLPKAVTWKRTGRDSNPRPFGLRANALLLRHTGQIACGALQLQSVYMELGVTCGRFTRIQQRLSLDKTDSFVSRLHCYWTLKRRSRNGAPLLRSMLFSFAHLARQRLLVTAHLHSPVLSYLQCCCDWMLASQSWCKGYATSLLSRCADELRKDTAACDIPWLLLVLLLC